MADKAGIILADRHRGIEQGRKGIGPDIPNQRRVLIQAVHHITDMLTVQLQQAALYHLL